MKTVPSIPIGLTDLPRSRPRSPLPSLRCALWLGLAILPPGLVSSVHGAAPWGTPIMEPGIAAVTCAVPQNIGIGSAYVFALFDFRTPPLPHSGTPFATASYGPYGPASPLWNPPLYHHPSWNVTNLGNVYGIAIDADGDMYTAAHGLYSKTWSPYHHYYGGLGGWNGTAAQKLAAAGTVYKIDRNTGVATVFAVVPGQQAINLGGSPPFIAGPGLGNIAYDRVNDQFFVTSLEDGKIYRFNNVGVLQQTYDPMTPDDGAPGMPQNRDRIWGIEVSRGAVFYAVWNVGTALSPGVIRRVPLLGGGAINTTAGADVAVLTVPFSPQCGAPGRAAYVPVSDITFSADGTKMVLGERTMLTEANAYNHDSRVHIAELIGAVWTVTRTLETGNSWGDGEAYGGVAYGPENGGSEQLIWMTSADTAGAPGPHGMQGTRPADFPLPTGSIVLNSYRVPFDPTATTAGPDNKGSGGDIEIMPTAGACCVNIAERPAECVETNRTYLWQMCVTNCWTNDLKYFSFVDVPAGVTLSAEIVTLPTLLKPGQGVCLDIYVTNSAGLANACFTVGAHSTNFLQCCSVTNCLTFAPCCLYITEERLTPVYMTPPMANCYNFTFLVKNVTVPPVAMSYLFLVQDPPAPPTTVTFSPQIITFSPPLLPGQSMLKTVKACFEPGSKGPYYFLAAAHNSNLVECCSVRECIPRRSVPSPIGIADGFDGTVYLAGRDVHVPVIIDGKVVRPTRATGYLGGADPAGGAADVVIGSIANPPDGQRDDWFVISNAVAGTYTLRAELLDELGGVWDSGPATIYVAEEVPPIPGTPAPALFLPAAALNGNQVRFLLPTEPGVTCHVEYTESLSPPNWKIFQTVIGDGSTVTIIDSTVNATQRFFRVRMP